MTEQELHDARRSELLSGIQAALSGPSAPKAPRVPGIPDDAAQPVRDAAIARINALPNHQRTADESAYLEAVRDASVRATLTKPIDQVSTEERAELLREIRACQDRGWQ